MFFTSYVFVKCGIKSAKVLESWYAESKEIEGLLTSNEGGKDNERGQTAVTKRFICLFPEIIHGRGGNNKR